MTPEFVVTLASEAIKTVLLLSLPLLGVGLAIGLAVPFFRPPPRFRR
jgi:flagellar biosynthetic protein FliQ